MVPEQLSSDAAAFEAARERFGLPDNFDLNAFENWLPSCGDCNGKKRDHVFRPTPIVQVHLDRAITRADEARAEAAEVPKARSLARALNIVLRAIDAELSLERIKPLVDRYREIQEAHREAASAPTAGTAPTAVTSTQAPAEMRVTPLYTVLYESGGIRMVQGPYGTGYVPATERPDSSFYCPHSGSLGPWNGTRCMTCGMMSEPD